MERSSDAINRRTVLKLIAGGVTALSLAACGYYDEQATKVKIDNDEYYFMKEKAYDKSPQQYQGKYYDISHHQFTLNDKEGILLPQEDFFPNERSLFHWRDTKITPEILEDNPIFQTITQRTAKYIQGVKETLGGMYGDFVLPQAVATAVRKTLIYDSRKAMWGSLLPLDTRLKLGQTNCQEYVAAVAATLAWFGKPSDAVMHTYLDPNGSGRRLDHLYNAIDIDGRCWIIDATASEKPYAFWHFFEDQKNIDNNPEAGVIKYDSIFPNQRLPWAKPAWTTTVSSQDKMGPNMIAFAMEKVQL